MDEAQDHPQLAPPVLNEEMQIHVEEDRQPQQEDGQDPQETGHEQANEQQMLSDSGTAEWPAWFKTPGPLIQEPQRQLFCSFTHWMVKRAVDIWNGKEGLALEKAAQRTSRDAMIESLSSSAQDELVLCSWWNRIIVTGTSLRLWTIPLPAEVVKLVASPASFTRHDFQLLQRFRANEQRWGSEFQSGVVSADLPDLIVVSAIMEGGVTFPALLMAILNMQVPSVIVSGGEVVVALEVPRSDDTWEHQIWYPDAVTSVLILRWLSEGQPGFTRRDLPKPSRILKHAMKSLRELLHRLGWKDASSNTSKTRELLSGARVSHALQLCGYNAAYLGGDLVCQSVTSAVLHRLRGWQYRPRSAVDASGVDAPATITLTSRATLASQSGRQTETSDPNPVNKSADGQSTIDRESLNHAMGDPLRNTFDPLAQPVHQFSVLRRMIKILREADHSLTKLEGMIEAKGQSWWPIVYQLARWMKWRLGAALKNDDPTSTINAVKPSSAKRYLDTIARHLMVVVYKEDLLLMDIEDIEQVYEDSCGRIKSPRERGNFWMCVRSFHQFLILHGAPEISFQELDGYIGVRTALASANIVGEHEFTVFKSEVLRQKPACGSPLMRLLLVAILGFRLGLRRREIQMLWVHNFHAGAYPMLKVRASFLATLKSQSSRRMLDLRPLIPADELALLTAHHQLRQGELKGQQGLLFCNPDHPTVPLSPYIIFDPITQCFQRILGNDGPAFRFHHFRHSFATWTFLLMAVGDNPALLGSDSEWLERCGVTLARAQALKSRLHQRLLDTQEPITRRNLYELAAMLGHLSPLTSLKYYIHLLDWLSAREVDDALRDRISNWTLEHTSKFCSFNFSMTRKPPYSMCKSDRVQFLRLHLGHSYNVLAAHRAVTMPPPPAPDLAALQQIAARAPTPGPTQLLLLMSNALPILNSLWKLENRMAQKALQTAGDQSNEVTVGVTPDEEQSIRRRVDDRMQRMQSNQSLARQWIEAACQRYREVTVRRLAVLTEEQMLSIPRRKADREEFWRIMDTTANAFRDERNRADLVHAAEQMLARAGPLTGKFNIHSRFEELPGLVRGLVGMGLKPGDMLLTVRTQSPSRSASSAVRSTDATDGTPDKSLARTGRASRRSRERNAAAIQLVNGVLTALEALGVKSKFESQDSRQSLPIDGLMILRFIPESQAQGSESRTSIPDTPKNRSQNWLVRSANYAAIWILFARDYEDSIHSDLLSAPNDDGARGPIGSRCGTLEVSPLNSGEVLQNVESGLAHETAGEMTKPLDKKRGIRKKHQRIDPQWTEGQSQLFEE